jgi:hypothetical protein
MIFFIFKPIEGLDSDNCILECLKSCNENTCCGTTLNNTNNVNQNKKVSSDFSNQVQTEIKSFDLNELNANTKVNFKDPLSSNIGVKIDEIRTEA